MCKYKRKGGKAKYGFLDRECIGRRCFAPGEYQHRGATLSGSRNTGDCSQCCMCRAYHGCPHPLPPYDGHLAAERKRDGWKLV